MPRPPKARLLVLDAAERIVKAHGAANLTYDFARLMEGATEVKCSEFADRLIAAM